MLMLQPVKNAGRSPANIRDLGIGAKGSPDTRASVSRSGVKPMKFGAARYRAAGVHRISTVAQQVWPGEDHTLIGFTHFEGEHIRPVVAGNVNGGVYRAPSQHGNVLLRGVGRCAVGAPGCYHEAAVEGNLTVIPIKPVFRDITAQ